MILFGIVSTFFGGKWFDEFAGVVGGGITFIYSLLIFSVLGMTRALDSADGSWTIVSVILLILTFLMAGTLAFGIFWYC
jgi:hypothetical protein